VARDDGRRDGKSRGEVGGAVINREWPASLARFRFVGVAQQGVGRGGREASFSSYLVRPFAAPVNAGVGRLSRSR
jgi:acyl-CoA reductase-like NAD-dependent aldehyde dehydrogenase